MRGSDWMARWGRVLGALALAVGAVVAQTSSKDLTSRLPKTSLLVERAGGIALVVPPTMDLPVVGVTDEGHALLDVDGRRYEVDKALLEGERRSVLTTLRGLIDRVPKDHGATVLRLRDHQLLGPHLWSSDLCVLPEGPLLRCKAAALPEVSALEAAVAVVKADVSKGSLSLPGQRALTHLLEQLAREGTSDMFLSPDFARRVVRHGFLAKVLGDLPSVAALRSAVELASRPLPKSLFEGPGGRITHAKDAFGGEAWLLATPVRAGFQRALPKPAYWEGAPDLTLTVSLPVGSDAFADAGNALGATVFFETQPVARWSLEGGFRADPVDWREAVLRDRSGIDDASVSDFFPPHVPIFDLKGDFVALYTPHGAVRPPSGAGPADVERFLEEAARALPTAGYLDLVGETMFFYVHDSPEIERPWLIGFDQARGEIHQTVAQTVSTVTGGICRGDCDDIAELYQEIAKRQGRLGHILNLPGHAAFGFATKDEVDLWQVHVLQTGQPLEFKDASLPKALEKAYKHFGFTEAFDPDQLGIAVRFSGENTRSSWVLGWRIFSDRSYAEAMIDVQRDWHFHTYRRAIAKMEKMVAAGDTDPANLRELAGLCEFTGQWAECARFVREAMRVSPDPTLGLATRLLTSLYRSGNLEAAREEARRILEEKLPAAQEAQESAILNVAMTVADVLITEGKEVDLAGRILVEYTSPMIREIGLVGFALQSGELDPETWRSEPELQETKRIARALAATSMALLDAAPAEKLSFDINFLAAALMVENWLYAMAFHDVEQPSDLLLRVANAGEFYRILLGREFLHALVDKATLPTVRPDAKKRPRPAVGQLRVDVPWLKVSVDYWTVELLRLFDKERAPLNREELLRLHARVRQAHAAARKLELEDDHVNAKMNLADLVLALATENEELLRARLRDVKRLDDKTARDSTTEWIGRTARFASTEWFGRVLSAFREEIHFKPAYFAIAWTAKLNDAPKHALQAARLAVETFPDDPSFREEYEFMKALLER